MTGNLMNKIKRELNRIFNLQQFTYFYRTIFKPDTIKIDGLTISSDTKTIPPQLLKSLIKGNHEFHERILIKKHLASDDRVLEIGASSGLVSLVCARICGVDNLLMYEAIPMMEPIIRKNFALNNLTPNLQMKAVTTDGSNISFFVSDNIFSSSMIDRSSTVAGKNITVSSAAFSKIVADFKPTALIMDVEGAEIELLSNFDLGTINKIIVELHPHIVGETTVKKLLQKLAGLGFENRETSGKTVLLER